MNRVFSLPMFARSTCVRRLSATEVRCKDSLAKIKQKQMHFQKDDDVPLFLKGGISDQVMICATVVLITFSLAASLHSTYKLAVKK